MITDTDAQTPKYIEVIDGRYTGARGYIKKENPPGTFLCVIWCNGFQCEVSLNKSQFGPIHKPKNFPEF